MTLNYGPKKDFGLIIHRRPEEAPESDVPALRERLRVQTLARYFAPARITADAVKSSSDIPAPAALSTNTHLTGLAQIGPLKLSCDRAFVSLLDTSTQYIIAEATRTISLRHSDRHATPQDALFLGCQVLDKEYGVCPNTVQVFTDDTGEHTVNNQHVVANADQFVIRDFRNMEAYAHKPYVVGFPHMRSYAEVPMKSSNGQVIGSYCVVDTVVRDDFFSENTIFTLAEIATSIVDYLEMLTTGMNHDRGTRLMEGLSQLADAEHSLTIEGHKSPTQFQLRHQEGSTTSGVSPTHLNMSRHDSDHSPRAIDGLAEPAVESSSYEHSTSRTTYFEDPDFGSSLPKSDKHQHQQRESQRHSVSSVHSAIFSKAAHLIRDAMEMDGLIFLDAPLNEAGEFVRQNVRRRSSNHTAVAAATAAEVSKSTNSLYNSKHSDDTTNDVKPSPPCQILASSLRPAERAPLHGPHEGLVSLDELSLRYLATRYPHGQIFFADDHGILVPDDEGGAPTWSESGDLRYGPPVDDSLPDELIKVFAASRSTIFLPLWNFSKERFFAGVLGWTVDPTRVFEGEDFTCLTAFGDALMTEIARVEATDIARAQTDFVSSISHELRSPLHGILASAELLDEVLTEDTQTELVRMIDSCGTTLLDTLNDLLDFSIGKYNKTDEYGSKRSHREASQQDTRGRNQDVDLAELLQSVMEGVYFGYTSKNLIHRNLASGTKVSDDRPSHSPLESGDLSPYIGNDNHVAVLINIEERSDWHVLVPVGGLKRIIMNIFANALKYTPRGQIEASLSTLIGKGSDGSTQQAARLIFSDTGIGMSAEYLRHRLYRPFAQENPVSDGTGLGLSIVKQIVDSIGGTISVQSDVGVGTRFDILLPFVSQPAPMNQETGISLAATLDPNGLLKGKTVCLVNLNDCPELGEVQTDPLSADSRRASAIKRSVTKILMESFGMVVITAQSLEEAETDFYLIEASLIPNLTELQTQHLDLFQRKRVVYIASTIRDRRDLASSNATKITYPIGPRTLSKALLRALKTDITAHSALHEPNVGLISEPRLQRAQETSTLPVRTSVTREKHLLLVDDNEINLRILSNYAKKLGCTTVTAENGSEAVKKYKASERRFDVVFMDMTMPVMDGFEATRRIRELEREATSAPSAYRTRVVALTGLGSDESRVKAFTCGVDEFCVKPVPLKGVKAILDAL